MKNFAAMAARRAAATVAAALALPAGKAPSRQAPGTGGVRLLLTDRRFLLFLLAAALSQASQDGPAGGIAQGREGAIQAFRTLNHLV